MTREELLRQEIDKYKRKIAMYQAMVSEWEGELGLSIDSGHAIQFGDQTAKKKVADNADPLSLVQGMIFFNKSQADAAKAFLEMVGYPLKTGLLLEAVEKGGLKVGGKTPAAKKQNFYTILHRSSDVGLAAKDTWGLTSWSGVTKKSAEETELEEGSSNGSEDAKKAMAEESTPS